MKTLQETNNNNNKKLVGLASHVPGQETLVPSGIKNGARFTDHVIRVRNWWSPLVEDFCKQSHCYF